MKRVRPALGPEHEQAYYRRVGLLIREIREGQGMGRYEFGKAVGLSRWTLINYEEGVRPSGHHPAVPMHIVDRVCSFVGMPVAQFYRRLSRFQG